MVEIFRMTHGVSSFGRMREIHVLLWRKSRTSEDNNENRGSLVIKHGGGLQLPATCPRLEAARHFGEHRHHPARHGAVR